MKKQHGLVYAAMCLVLVLAGCSSITPTRDETSRPAATASDSSASSDRVAPAAKEQSSSLASSGTTGAGDTSRDSSAAALGGVFETIYFEFDAATLSAEARKVLSQTAKRLIGSKNPKGLKVEGHCDERGSAEYNMALGEKRAQAALNYLATLGVPAERLSYISYGKERPVASGHDEQAWAKNRRDEFKPY
jgi:peptidoglycan-associated lipoprotein